MGNCLGTKLSSGSVAVRDNSTQGMIPETSKAWEEHNSLNTCSNEISKEFIGIYAKNQCQ